MIIVLWLACITLFCLTAVLLGFLLLKNPQSRETLRTFLDGFKEGLNFGGLGRRHYHVELWVWETADDEHVCEDCLERAAWPPMDIADWMKEGLPRTHESDTSCGENCRCQLVPFRPKKRTRHHHRH